MTDALSTVKKLRTGPAGAKVLRRADSAFYGHGPVGAAVRAGAQVSVTVRLDPRVKAAIAAIPGDGWARRPRAAPPSSKPSSAASLHASP